MALESVFAFYKAPTAITVMGPQSLFVNNGVQNRV
jgi:hypothetical protein